MTKYLGMSDIFIIFVVVKEIKSSSNKKVKKKLRFIWILQKKIIIFVLKVVETHKVKKKLLKNKILWHRKNLNLK